MATKTTTKKFAHKHNLPVTRLIHISMGDWKDGKDLIIHLTSDITYDTTTKANTSFWHTKCGKNMDYVDSNPREHTVNEAVIGNRGIKFCSHCGTQADFLKAFEAMKQFDFERDAAERRDRIARQKEADRKWETMCEVLGDEVADVLANRPAVYGERKNEFVYQIVKDCVTYNISMTISQEK